MSEKVFEYIDGLEREDRHIGCQDFEDYIHEHLPENIGLTEINKVLEFISIQCGYWYARWTFSPASNPDTEAHSESENWDILRQSFTNSLDDVYPEITESMVDDQSF
jgi:hypothetical protein